MLERGENKEVYNVFTPQGCARVISELLITFAYKKHHNVQYLPIEGLAAFNKATAELLFGADSAILQQQRVRDIKSSSCA